MLFTFVLIIVILITTITITTTTTTTTATTATTTTATTTTTTTSTIVMMMMMYFPNRAHDYCNHWRRVYPAQRQGFLCRMFGTSLKVGGSSIYWESSSQLTPIFFRGVAQPPTRHSWILLSFGVYQEWGTCIELYSHIYIYIQPILANANVQELTPKTSRSTGACYC